MMNSPPRDSEAAIGRGMTRQRQGREFALGAGAVHVGWKVAFTTPAARAAAGVERSLVGYLTDTTALDPGAAVSVTGWTRPMIEAELALFIGSDVTAADDLHATAAAITGIALAIEVVDIDLPLDQTEAVLAGDIFHRHYVLGHPEASRAGGDASGVRVEARLDGVLVAAEAAPTTIIGDLPEVVRGVAQELDRAGLELRSGDVIMAGSAIPLTPVSAGQHLRVSATGLGELDLYLAA